MGERINITSNKIQEESGLSRLRIQQIKTIKIVCAFLQVKVPAVIFADDADDEALGIYNYLTGDVILFKDSTIETAAHEAVHHAQYELDYDRAFCETHHGNQFQYLRKKVWDKYS